jgi:excisionase family DNA binding protein
VIRTTISYTVQEIANLLDVQPNTVRKWLREGLGRIDDRRPYMIDGAELKRFLQARRARRAEPGSVSIELQNKHVLRIVGRCVDCGSRLNRAGSVRRLDEYREVFGDVTTRERSIEGDGLALVNRDLQMETSDA